MISAKISHLLSSCSPLTVHRPLVLLAFVAGSAGIASCILDSVNLMFLGRSFAKKTEKYRKCFHPLTYPNAFVPIVLKRFILWMITTSQHIVPNAILRCVAFPVRCSVLFRSLDFVAPAALRCPISQGQRRGNGFLTAFALTQPHSASCFTRSYNFCFVKSKNPQIAELLSGQILKIQRPLPFIQFCLFFCYLTYCFLSQTTTAFCISARQAMRRCLSFFSTLTLTQPEYISSFVCSQKRNDRQSMELLPCQIFESTGKLGKNNINHAFYTSNIVSVARRPLMLIHLGSLLSYHSIFPFFRKEDIAYATV